MQPKSVRASTRFYPRFTLTMGRSPGFGSTACDYNPLPSPAERPRLFQTRFRCGSGCHPLSLATDSNSPAHSTKGTPSARAFAEAPAPGPLTVCRSEVSGSISLPCLGFFSPFPHGTLHYRSPSVFSLTLWSAQIPPGFRVSRGTRVSSRRPVSFRLRGCHPLWRRFPPDLG